jgi:hypothetical protein
METPFLLTLASLTSLAALVVGRRAFDLGLRSLGPALFRGLETLGAALLFWTANVLLGVFVALAVRGLDLGFVSIYVNTDLTLGVLSLVQALVFEAWRDGGHRASVGARR